MRVGRARVIRRSTALRSRLAPLLALSLALTACEGLPIELPFFATPTPAPTPPPVARTPAPTPTPKPTPKVEVPRFVVAVVDPRVLSAAIGFRLKNPSTDEWLLQANAGATLFTPDGRLIPQARPTAIVDLAPGEEKWFAFPSVDTFGSIVGKVEVGVSGGQWVTAALYPYPGGAPISVVRAPAEAQPRAPSPAPGAAPGASPPVPLLTANFLVTNNGDLGVNGIVRGFAFDDKAAFLGLIECPVRLYPARAETLVGCAAPKADAVRGTRVDFVAYPDLRPVLVLPTPSPSPSPGAPAAPRTPQPSPTGR